MDNLALIGKWLFLTGLAVAGIGGLLWLLSKIPGLNSLPGTIRIQGSGFTCVIPLLASILLSIVLTLILNLVARLLRH